MDKQKQIEDCKTFWKRSTMEIITFTEGSLADIIQLARKDINSLITTIETQDEKLTRYEKLFMSIEASFLKFLSLTNIKIATHPSVELQAEAVNQFLESQKEEIEKLNEVIRTLGLSLQNTCQEGKNK